MEWISINFACSLASDAKPGVKYPETNAGYEAWVKAKKEAEEEAEIEAEIRGKSTTVVHVLHWKDSTIYDLPYDGKKFFLTQEEALNWAKNNFERWDAWDESLLNTGKWKIVSTDSGNIVDFDPFLWNYDGFNSQEDFWSNPIVYNYNDDDFYTPKRWDEDDEEKEIAKAIAKILRSKAFNLGLGLKLSMKKCGMFDDSDVM